MHECANKGKRAHTHPLMEPVKNQKDVTQSLKQLGNALVTRINV